MTVSPMIPRRLSERIPCFCVDLLFTRYTVLLFLQGTVAETDAAHHRKGIPSFLKIPSHRNAVLPSVSPAVVYFPAG